MLAETLRHIRTAQDTRLLFEALGYTPDCAPFDEGAHVVARWHGFKVIAVDAEQPSDRARALARRLGRLGERALALAVGPNRSLALAAPTLAAPGTTPALVLSLDQPGREALNQLASLRPTSGTTGLAQALKVAELLASEVAGQRFFAAFRMTLERMAASQGSTVPSTERRVVALLALTRVLFLYFVQAKGWLDGRHDYLRQLLDTSLTRRRSFHRCALQPLFFGTLNQPAKARSKRFPVGAIPYLNGGLFEPHPVERRHGMPTFSNALWRDAFDDVFERFRFCVREAHEVDAIAPDMLGRVFERLMDAGERHNSGTFYTPERVVREIVEAALTTALSGVGRLSEEVARAVVERKQMQERDRARASVAVRRLRILDPAVGSGAFLLGALEVLTEIRLTLESERRKPDRRLRLRREVLEESLFGVDVNPIAVRLAELRLWLAVVADDPTTAIADITPLPNLDGVVRQGDTLLDPVGAARACHVSFPGLLTARATARVRSARCRLFDARGGTLVRVSRELQRAEHALASRLLGEALSATEQAYADLSAAARDRDLFGNRVRLAPAQEMRLRMLRQSREELSRARHQMELGVVPFFSFEVHTPDVLARGGFSIVLGNPPWVRAERLSPARRCVLRNRFAWWRGTRGRGYAHLPDLAIAFLERSLELTAPGGAVGLLLPSKVFSAGYGETARQHLVRETSVVYAHRVPEREAAQFGATTYPVALVLRKRPPDAKHQVLLSFDGCRSVPQRSLAGEGPWILLPAGEQSAIRELQASGRPLRELAEPSLGIKTGADSVLVGELLERTGKLATVRFGVTAITIESSVLRSAIRGRDVTPFKAQTRWVVLWGYTATARALDRLPPRAARHIRSNAAVLRRRADYRKGPLWTLFRQRASVSSHRVVWPDLARRPRAVALDETTLAHALPLNTCYVAPAPDRETALVIAAVMNSSWAGVLIRVVADEARGGYCRVNARVTGQVPIPIAGRGLEDLIGLSSLAHNGHHVSQLNLDETVANALRLRVGTRKTLARMAAALFGSAAGRR
jgi:hypothetical protein